MSHTATGDSSVICEDTLCSDCHFMMTHVTVTGSRSVFTATGNVLFASRTSFRELIAGGLCFCYV
jgi:hypothetical protein